MNDHVNTAAHRIDRLSDAGILYTDSLDSFGGKAKLVQALDKAVFMPKSALAKYLKKWVVSSGFAELSRDDFKV
ncbi:hypothetical protein AGR1A_Lc100004 [Agrobacterium fabacearum CFBP 5771]|nr:hypothetical protein AGR1A_Lc100004 [Agrobacterium fabacearum CFBP 5771]